MTDLLHSVPISAEPARVYASIATQAGMRGWWTRDTTMMPFVGGRAEFGFDKREMVFRMVIEQLEPDRTLRLRCSGDHPEWAGTILEWKIEPTPAGTVLHFAHRGWRAPTDFAATCNSMWGQLMFRLKAYTETGTANPQWTE